MRIEFLLYRQQTIPAQTISIPLFQESSLFRGQHHSKTLALCNRTRFAFKRFITSLTGFCFVLAHTRCLQLKANPSVY
jgi:hypothetical protein